MPEHLRQNQLVAELFLREARAAAALNHPNIVTVYDAGEGAEGYPCRSFALAQVGLDDEAGAE